MRKISLKPQLILCANCKDIAYLLTEISVIGWHAQVVLSSLLTNAHLNLERELCNTIVLSSHT